MNRFEGFITPHIGDKMFQCDDQFAVNLKNFRFAIADGSSSDFFSKIYSRLLSDAYVNDGEKALSEISIDNLNEQWKVEVINKLSLAGCRPGSFPYVRFQKRDPGCSTLVGLTLISNSDNKNVFQCVGLGDSMMFFIPLGSLIPKWQFSSDTDETYSFNPDIVFGYTPVIANSYSTNWIENIRSFSRELENGVFILVTDGLAEWLLHEKDNSIICSKFQRLLEIHSETEFIAFINNIRKEENAKNDDMTLLKIYIEDSTSLEFDVNSSHLFDYRAVATREEFIDNELKKETAIIKQRLSAQNSISLSAVITQKEKELEKLIEAKYKDVVSKIEKKHKQDILKIEAKHREEIDNVRTTVETETTTRLQEDFIRQENEIRSDEKRKVISEMTSSAVPFQDRINSIITAEREKWESCDLPSIIEREHQKWINDELPRIIAEERKKWEDVVFPERLKEHEERWKEEYSIKKKIKKIIQSKIGKGISVVMLLLIIAFIVVILFVDRNSSQSLSSEKSNIELNKSK